MTPDLDAIAKAVRKVIRQRRREGKPPSLLFPELEGVGVDAPAEFPEFGSLLDTTHCCPKCGYKWS